ncbi:hypothetical protein G6F61_006136 [Rhizopus arrhizus]|nr:hypothetical protein G6F61_006136 [Rhizopus arrhizus]
MLRQLNTLSKLTTSSIKYAANNTAAFVGLSSKDDSSMPSAQMTAYWISETQKGLDAFFNDEFELAQTIFMQHHQESPFHAVGFALMAYVEAMLGFESEKIQVALERITAAELLARQFIKKVRRKSWHKSKHEQENTELDLISISFDNNHSTKKIRSPEIHYELLATNCMLMSSTIQFLKNSWLEYMKAAYKLRKAYKLYDQMFETVTGQKASEYATHLRKKTPEERRQSLYSPHEKRLSLFATVDRKVSFDHLTHLDVNIKKQRPMSTMDSSYYMDESRDLMIIENAIESGIFFGIGLFSLVFSLLPPKINKILNTLGFRSSRPFALHLLQKSFKNLGLYSSLSALSLLAYYTNLSLFIHPRLLPNSLSLGNAREILDQMKTSFPSGKIWKLLEGKLCKMEGKTRRGVEILRDARRRESIRIDLFSGKLQSLPQKKKDRMVCELAQLQALAVYEMGWGQIFLGDYFQAAETFFRLESMNNWSRAFYHYIATCCMFADEEYDKAAIEFMQIPGILKRKRQLGGKLLPNEIFAERKIKHWKSKSMGGSSNTSLDDFMLDGTCLKNAIVVNPLWELIYLWNGFSQLTKEMVQSMKRTIEHTLEVTSKKEEDIGPDAVQLYLLLGVSARELGDHDLADKHLRKAIQLEDGMGEDKWVLPHVYYELAALNCFKLLQTNEKVKGHKLLKEAENWIQKCERQLSHRQNTNNHNVDNINDSVTSDNSGDSDWDSRLHVRCQLLIEKLDDFKL